MRPGALANLLLPHGIDVLLLYLIGYGLLHVVVWVIRELNLTFDCLRLNFASSPLIRWSFPDLRLLLFFRRRHYGVLAILSHVVRACISTAL